MYPLVFVPEMNEDSDDDDEDGDDANDGEVGFEHKDLLITGSADTSIKIWALYSSECLHVRVQ